MNAMVEIASRDLIIRNVFMITDTKWVAADHNFLREVV